MRKSADLLSIQRTLVFIKSYLRTNIAVVILGKDIALHDFTIDRTVFREELSPQGLEKFIHGLLHFKRALYVVYSANHEYFDIERHMSHIEYLEKHYGYIPKPPKKLVTLDINRDYEKKNYRHRS